MRRRRESVRVRAAELFEGHYHFGPMKIKMYLKRYHDIDIASSAVYRILKRLGMNRLPAS